MRHYHRLAIALLAVALATPAAAHPGHGENAGFIGGLIHPFTGLDHLAAMLMSGIWAAQLPIKAKWRGPATFVAAMIAGFGIARTGTAFAAEFVITASLIGLPVLILTARRAPLLPQFSCLALFAFAHGFAHGAESGPTPGTFLVGMVVATAILHGAGLWLGRALLTRRKAGSAHSGTASKA